MAPNRSARQVEVAPVRDPASERAGRRLLALERLVRAIEEELSDDGLSDEQTLQHIGERVAAAMDGR